jgi:hypothetical protein
MANIARRRRLWLFIPLLLGLAITAGYWLWAHPQHNPFAPLRLAQPIGWATQGKLAALTQDEASCFALLKQADIRYTRLPATGSGTCFTDHRTRIADGQSNLASIRPAGVAPSCAVSASLTIWQRDVVQPLALRHLGKRVASIEHLGSYNCRMIAGSRTPSEHATGNAIDIAAFILSDGQRITLLDHWDTRDGRSAFLQSVRDQSCAVFKTVLSPDYNAAHANHFHFDQAKRAGGWDICQ